jgi:Coenzyme PQQ synthesis protein D (PqqD)
MSTGTPTRATDLDIHEVEDGLVVYQPARDRVHYLNQTSAVVFELCTGKNTEDVIVGLVQAAWGLDHPPRNEVMTCLTQLRDEEIVR